MKPSFSILLLLSCFSIVILQSQDIIRKGNDYAYLFYVASYKDQGWPSLPETEVEIKELANELIINYGFKVEVMNNSTKQEIFDKITHINNRDYGPKDQVLFFFSMHGYFSKDSDRGYLIPSDGKYHDIYGKSWISYDDLGSYITVNNSKHILLALDACYSGAFGDRYRSRPGVAPWNKSLNCEEKVDKALEYNSRIYFTSGSRDERTPAKSLFASRWLETLRLGYEIGVISINDLRYNLSTIETFKPESGFFTSKHEEGGDFVFVYKGACENSEIKILDETDWNNMGPNPSEKELLVHLSQFYNNCSHVELIKSNLLLTQETENGIKQDENKTRPPLTVNPSFTKDYGFYSLQLGVISNSTSSKNELKILLQKYRLPNTDINKIKQVLFLENSKSSEGKPIFKWFYNNYGNDKYKATEDLFQIKNKSGCKEDCPFLVYLDRDLSTGGKLPSVRQIGTRILKFYTVQIGIVSSQLFENEKLVIEHFMEKYPKQIKVPKTSY